MFGSITAAGVAVAVFLTCLLQPTPTTASYHAEPVAVLARTTYYTDSGYTASGVYTQPGVAACSYSIPMYAQITLSDGRVYTCLDRGDLNCNHYPAACPIWTAYWIDLFADYPVDDYDMILITYPE